MSSLEQLYKEMILDHNKYPRNFGVLDDPTHCAEGYNPLCGDKYTVYLKVDDGKIVDISFEGGGCAISKSSASLMTTALKGATLEDANCYFGKFHQMLTEDLDLDDLPEKLAKVAALQGVKEFPIRIKCATLIWHTMKSALAGKEQASTEE